MEEITNDLPETLEVVDIQFRPGQKVYFFDPNGMKFVPGDPVIMDTARGPEFGTCAGANHMVRRNEVVAPLRPVLRRATAQDLKIVDDNRTKEKRAYEVCIQKIAEHGLDMQLVSAECAFDGSKILFYFTADERVDFRELVKNLAGIFHTRIELRQIGVRDKAKMVGGLGICGRPFCCASFLDDFQPVSIKMAKTQNLSLNPTKISGTCGRLMCCLKYEQDAYEDLIRSSPKLDSFVDTPEGRGTVIELDLMRQRVKVRMEESPETVSVFANTDIAVLRSGKAKKNDPPIPADLAPISGAGKRQRKEEKEDSMVLEPIRFRYSEEAVVEEPTSREEQPEMPQEKPAEKSGRSRRRRKSSDPDRKNAAKDQSPKPAGEGTKGKPAPDAGKTKPAQESGKAKPNGDSGKPKAGVDNGNDPNPEGKSPEPARNRRRRPGNRRKKPNKPQEG